MIQRRSSLILMVLFALALMLLTVGLALAQAPAGQEYIVQPGDRLTTIAVQFLGNPGAYPQIVEATNAKAAEDATFAPIDDPNLLIAGQKLWIPVPGLAGTYTANLPAASSPGRAITLTLSADTAQLSADYLNGEAPIVETGTWQDNSDGTATVMLTGRADGTVYEAPSIIKFKLENDTLTAVEYDQTLYGSEGLTLQKQSQAAPALQPEEVAGIYKVMLPGASSPGLDMTLYLNVDNTVRQVSDYLNGEPPIVESGTWQIEGNQVLVTLTGQEGQPYETPSVETLEVSN
ncbi:MAG TPA: copper resistance protein NlpE N-terminal domain-containing protein, partial [Anaerolineae bacterium]|nr:copper resistance protein NlpE N-terminal domain-containing protein [Anaerolineae bacterium]